MYACMRVALLSIFVRMCVCMRQGCAHLVCVWVYERERESMCAFSMYERERERESMCAFSMCVCVCVCVYEREKVHEILHVCMCVYMFVCRLCV
jgi:hypothetical protein